MLANGKVLIRRGHCEGGAISLLDPVTGEMSYLGDEGSINWNASRTAFVVTAQQYIMIEKAIWGYNISDDFLFLPQPDVAWQLDDLPVWTPDGTHILFQHRLLSYSLDKESYSFPTARQIIRVDATSGEQTILLDDIRYDFDFCEGHGATCSPWHGDWIQVRRLPFEPDDIPFDFDFYLLPEATCLVDGVNCAESPVLFALNWRTHELIPWDEAVLPTPLPTQTRVPGIPYG
jgi:hypothetical protein